MGNTISHDSGRFPPDMFAGSESAAVEGDKAVSAGSRVSWRRGNGKAVGDRASLSSGSGGCGDEQITSNDQVIPESRRLPFKEKGGNISLERSSKEAPPGQGRAGASARGKSRDEWYGRAG